jgi:hypothetical protein
MVWRGKYKGYQEAADGYRLQSVLV